MERQRELQWELHGFYDATHSVNQVMTWSLINFRCGEIMKRLRIKRRKLENFVIIRDEDEFPKQVLTNIELK